MKGGIVTGGEAGSKKGLNTSYFNWDCCSFGCGDVPNINTVVTKGAAL